MRTRQRFIMTALLTLVTGVADAQGLLIRNATVHTLTSKGQLENTDVLIEDGRIKAIGKGIQSAGIERTIDAAGKVVTPGIMAVFNQIGIREIDALETTVDGVSQNEAFGASFNLAEVFNPFSTLVPHNRINGVTRTLVTPYPGHDLFAGQATIFSLSGEHTPILKRTAAIYAQFGEQGAALAGGSRAAALMQLNKALDDAREFAEHREAIRRGEWRELSLPADDLEALLDLVDGEIPLIVGVERASDIVSLLRFAKRQEIRLVIAGGAEAWMVAAQLAEAKVPVILDPMDNIPGSFQSLGQRADNAALLHKAGVEVIFTGPGFQSSHNAYLVRQAAGNAVANGMPYDAALKAFTLTPARVFGGATEYGRIAPGLQAELVIWDGDPLEVTSEPVQVIIGGKAVAMVSRATRLRDRYMDITNQKEPAYRR